ncbi:DUF2827 family protein [Burkholderia sp. Bp8986]|uniref:DUF2827 family protein n=1 Tax=Burkholderia sp. Bp8986 TaxID=2184550 RepID=UPI000F5A9D2B|nr:DUF2827 family protein [Burkholderia sp. Bp8986]RQS52769.1 DUF2827 family protein [Burkholderia sp. Bp8986]
MNTSTSARLGRADQSLRIGVTIGLQDEAESLWVNGIKQNALYLMRVFQHSPLRHRAMPVNTRSVAITSKLPWDIAHQCGLALNYFYFDVCWNGYSFVHNARLCSDLGYYDPGQDVDEGARQLVQAIRHHDSGWEEYRAYQRKSVGRFLSTNDRVVARYDELLLRVSRIDRLTERTS